MRNRLNMTQILALLFLCGLICVAPKYSFAQETDTELWSGAKFEYKISKKWNVALEQQQRFNDNIGQLDRNISELEVGYKINKSWDLAGGFRYTGTQDRTGRRQGYKEYYRLQFDVKHDFDVNRAKIKNRFRAQKRSMIENPNFLPRDDRSYLRWKPSVEYDIKNWKLDPVVFGELFYEIDNAIENQFSTYRLGLETDLNLKAHKITFGYVRENGIGHREGRNFNILRIKYGYEFKPKKKKGK